MEKVIIKTNIKQQTSDFQYWQQQTPKKRLVVCQAKDCEFEGK